MNPYTCYPPPLDVMSDILDGVSDLETAAKVLEARADDGNLTVFVDGVKYVVAEQNITGLVSCSPGMTRVSILCGKSHYLFQCLSIMSV